MTGSDLFREVGNISEEYIIEAESYTRMVSLEFREWWRTKIVENAAVRRSLATVACLAVCFGLFTMVQRTWTGWSATDSAAEYSKNDAAAKYDGDGAAAEVAQDMESSVTMGAAESAASSVADSAASASQSAGENTSSAVTASGSVKSEEGSTKDSVTAENKENEEDVESLCSYPLQTEDMQNAEWDLAAIKERQAAYPEDLEELQKLENVYVILHGEAKSGQAGWEDFLARVDAGNTAQIDIIRFTVEGDAIIETVHFDGEQFRLCVDNSRDAFRGSGSKYYEAEYKYLQCVETSLEDGTGTVEYMLTDCEEDISEILSSGDEKRKAELQYYSIVYIVE